jgi:hypothetical protein
MKARDWLLIAAFILLLWALWAGTAEAQETPVEASGTPSTYYLPLVGANAFPAALPPAEGTFLQVAVNVDVWMGGNGGYDWMRADTLLTYWQRREDGTLDATICWYGVWQDGKGAGTCELYQ